ncbi:hypothetical protein [Maridesulfovibrio sp.]|uniref:hypothetical protein n=1 Tax=Maridesulfovibrio sp. TaxID=2795000 RepID=UPI0029CA5A47|nr:hypothetical protein [Maridesulfovibrio sp.]
MGIELFANRPVEPDTNVLHSQFENIGGLDVLLELWSWDGIIGQSAILIEEQVAGREKPEIIELISSEISLGSNYTTSKESGFIFINYGFKDSDDILLGDD